MEAKTKKLLQLFDLLEPVPDDWLREAGSKSEGGEVKCLTCDNYKTVISAWRKALKWTDGLDCALSVMMASISSTMSVGDQLWIKVVGPASCGKSSLCEALSVNRNYVYPKDTFTGLSSGYQTDQEGKENLSLVDKLDGKTLLINDGDTLLQMPNLTQIFSQLRAFYGRNLRSQFKNKMSKDHEAISTTVIICGTSSLRSMDTSELGERFLDCVIMEGIDEDLEDEILWRVVNKSVKNMSTEVDGRPETQQSPEMTEAMSLTGGYIDYLRKNTQRKLDAIEVPEWALHKCMRLGKFVALLRSRPSKTQVETAEREFAARLVSQHSRLMLTLALVLNRKKIDKEVLRRTVKVALDTSRGTTFMIVKYLHDKGEAPVNAIATHTGIYDAEVRKLLKFLRQIKVVTFKSAKLNGVKNRSNKPQWRLTNMMDKLYKSVMGETQ